MSKSDVTEMVNLCKGLGLRVAFEGGQHYTVRDPNTEAKLFYISSTPSDSKFKYEIARHLRRLGLLKGNLKFGKFQTVKKRKNYGAYDLVALKAAQDKAASLGERIPLLEDIEDQTEFFKTIRTASNSSHYTKEAQQEAIEQMAMKLTPRGNATKQRLRKILDERNIKNSDFVRTAMEVAEKRDLRGFRSMNAGQSAIGKFRNDDDTTVQIWTMNLIEATLDHIEGLKFGEIDESLKNGGTEPTEPTEPEPEILTTTDFDTKFNELREWVMEGFNLLETRIESQTSNSSNTTLRDRYADTLLNLLATNPSMELDTVMRRLDKLVGIEV